MQKGWLLAALVLFKGVNLVLSDNCTPSSCNVANCPWPPVWTSLQGKVAGDGDPVYVGPVVTSLEACQQFCEQSVTNCVAVDFLINFVCAVITDSQDISALLNIPDYVFSYFNCVDPCDNYDCGLGTCTSSATGQASCNCTGTGYTGDHCQTSICQGVNCGPGVCALDPTLTATICCCDGTGFQGLNCQEIIPECPEPRTKGKPAYAPGKPSGNYPGHHPGNHPDAN